MNVDSKYVKYDQISKNYEVGAAGGSNITFTEPEYFNSTIQPVKDYF